MSEWLRPSAVHLRSEFVPDPWYLIFTSFPDLFPTLCFSIQMAIQSGTETAPLIDPVVSLVYTTATFGVGGVFSREGPFWRYLGHVLNRLEAVWASGWHQRDIKKGAENDAKVPPQKGVELCPLA